MTHEAFGQSKRAIPSRRDLKIKLQIAAPPENTCERRRGLICFLALFFLVLFCATPAAAAEHLHGGQIPIWESLPFAGLLLSIALGPIFAKKLWHVHYGKAASFWAALALGLLIYTAGFQPTLTAFSHSMLTDYLPFILMLFALYAPAGGIVVSELRRATPSINTALLAVGTLASSLIGPIGASMIVIRPVLQANAKRRHQLHVVIFFIFLVSNIGGVLTPLGNPPLFFGFLRGVDFFWPLTALWQPMLLTVTILLAGFFLLDLYFFRKDAQAAPRKPHAPETYAESTKGKAEGVETAAGEADEETLRLTIRGLPNVALILAVVAVIVTTAVWHPGISFDFIGVHFELQNLVRDMSLFMIGLLSILFTPKEDHKANHFSWEPLEEVAKLFAAIFICIIPVMAMLAATKEGPFAPVIALLSHADGSPNNAAYFWATGLLSSFLDNGPTYLVFFVLAGNNAHALMGPLAKTLEAISLGAVFMGALTYIGNAPNFMVYALARRARVDMPGFFGYMAWSGAILVPVFILVTVVFLI
jgi:Na+/H+ antiporter NhaD/arsenite permease-like protein